MIIKAVLLLGVLAAGIVVLRGGASGARLVLRRGMAILVLATGAAAILFPNALTRLANLVGVGRGADLVLYVLVLTFFFVSTAVYRRLHELEDRYVELARQLAIDEAQRGGPIATGRRDTSRVDSSSSRSTP